MKVEVWSDIACPWCWVGKRNLEEALAEFGEDVELHWRAFELNPGAPTDVPKDVDYVGLLATKYRASREEGQAMIDRMTAKGSSVGLDFRFDRVRPGNTFDAHRLLSWSAEFGKQNELKEGLFTAYMSEGELVCDRSVLIGLAADVGLDAEAAELLLLSDGHADEVRAEESRAHRLAVTGVPFFLIDDRVAIPGAQPKEIIVKALRKARAMEDEAKVIEPQGESCGPDGCA